MNAAFVIETRGDYFAFTFWSDGRSVCLFSRLFPTEAECRQAINETIRALARPGAVERLADSNGRYSFILRLKNDPCFAHSPVFYAASTREFALRQLQQQAGKADIKRAQIRRAVLQSLF